MSSLDPRGQLPSAREHRTAIRLLVAGLVSVSLVLSMSAIPSVAEEVTPPAEPVPAQTVPVEAPPVETPLVEVVTPPSVMPTSIGSWCTALFPMSVKKQRTEAQLLMNGTVDMGKGGVYKLSQQPNWRAQASADLSGNRHIHSLD